MMAVNCRMRIAIATFCLPQRGFNRSDACRKGSAAPLKRYNARVTKNLGTFNEEIAVCGQA